MHYTFSHPTFYFMTKSGLSKMEVQQMFWIGGDGGLRIWPTPDKSYTLDYKFLVKRNWWQFWKPKWIYIANPFTLTSDGEAHGSD